MHRVEGLVQRYSPHGSVDQRSCFAGRGGAVAVDPGALLADVGDLHQVGVEIGLLSSGAEGGFVHQRAAGGDYDPVDSLFLDVLFDEVLTGVGAHELVVAR